MPKTYKTLVKSVGSKNTTLARAKPIISVNEARKLLRAAGKSLSDDDIKAMLRDYEALARHAVRQYLVRK